MFLDFEERSEKHDFAMFLVCIELEFDVQFIGNKL